MMNSSKGRRSETGHNLFKDKPKKKTKDSKKDTPPLIRTSEYGRYQIKSALLAGEFVARAFVKPPTMARGLIGEARGATEEAAIAALHDVIDARETRRVENRRADSRTNSSVPSTEEFVEALRHVSLTRPQRAMLTALSLADAEGLTETRMASSGGYKSLASADRSLSSAGRLLAAFLSTKTVASASSADLEGRSLLGFRGDPKDDEDPGNWILHPELRDAIRTAL